jgi:hypothetical protein
LVMPCSVEVEYQHFGGLLCLHLQGEEAARSFETLVSYRITTRRHHGEDRHVETTNTSFVFVIQCTLHYPDDRGTLSSGPFPLRIVYSITLPIYLHFCVLYIYQYSHSPLTSFFISEAHFFIY